MKRILLLHGYGGNGAVFSRKIDAIRQQCGNDCEFVALDGPVVLTPEEIPQTLRERHGIGARMGTLTGRPIQYNPRAWWLRHNPKTLNDYVKFVIRYMNDQIMPFDGVLGFSNGAEAAALLTALLEHPEFIPIITNGQCSIGHTGRLGRPHPPLRFCICIAGFRPRSLPTLDLLFDHGIYTPTLHIIGEGDQLVPAGISQQLVNVCLNSRVEKHEGGHIVPSSEDWTLFLASYICLSDHGQAEAIPSPGQPIDHPFLQAIRVLL